MPNFAVITGTSGAIGSAIADRFKMANYNICGIDIAERQNSNLDLFIKADLNTFVIDNNMRSALLSKIKKWLGGGNSIRALINNAAYQYVSKEHPIEAIELGISYNVNVIAPYLLITHLADQMTTVSGSVVNVGSIHSRLTKPGFVAYSTTKAALSALTRGLAVDYEDQFRINCIEPASVKTPMLIDGFKNNPDKILELESYHPQKRIATPEEIAEIIFQISSSEVRFLHGACIDVSGGISCRLHDPA